MTREETESVKFQKSYFDVLGLCCSSEIPLIEKILKPLEGIKKVSVIVPSRTVIVVHDNLLISQIQIVKALNQAKLEANVRVFGQQKVDTKWPSPYTLVSGFLLLLSLFKFIYPPMQWLAVAAVAAGLPPIVQRALTAIRTLTFNINILVLITVGGSIALNDYWEAATIVFLFTFAEWLESRASYKSNAVMSSLISMVPQTARLAENGVIVDTRDVKINTMITVKAGDIVPIDGIVVEGKSEVDESTLTGESFPVVKQPQSNVWAGTINLNGYLTVRTTASAEDSAVTRVAKLVEEAQNNKSKTQRIIDKCAQFYTPVVVFISAFIAITPVALKLHDRRFWFHLALVVLVSACPCALILSTPVVTFCALTKAATSGVLIKGGDYLELLAKLKTVAFDKTGTITRGEFSVTQFQSLHPDISFHTLLRWVVSLETKSSHPMASALEDYGREHSVEPEPEKVKEFEIFPGEGIHGEIDGNKIYVEIEELQHEQGVAQVTDPLSGFTFQEIRLTQKKMDICIGVICRFITAIEEVRGGVTVIYVFLDATPIGTCCLLDTCRSGVEEAIIELKSFGIKTAMLTGDSHAAAMHVQHQLKERIEIVHAELLPQDKVKLINEFKKDGATAMVGDGMNDAPALAMADVGISMGIAGSAVANESGHITLMSNDIRKIPMIIKLAHQSRRKIIQNVIVSFLTKMGILGLAFSGHPLLWAAVLADVGTCLLVIFNSMIILQGSKRFETGCRRTSGDFHGKVGRSRQGHKSSEHEDHGDCRGCHFVQNNYCSHEHENKDCCSETINKNRIENDEHCSIVIPCGKEPQEATEILRMNPAEEDQEREHCHIHKHCNHENLTKKSDLKILRGKEDFKDKTMDLHEIVSS